MMFIRAGKNAVRACCIVVKEPCNYSLLAGGNERRSRMNKQAKDQLNKCKKRILKGVAKTILTIDANSASCILMNQPEVPEGLRRYRLGFKNKNV